MPPGTAASSWDLPETFSFEGQQVRYGTLGSGKPLVLIHGTPFSSVCGVGSLPIWPRIGGSSILIFSAMADPRCGRGRTSLWQHRTACSPLCWITGAW